MERHKNWRPPKSGEPQGDGRRQWLVDQVLEDHNKIEKAHLKEESDKEKSAGDMRYEYAKDLTRCVKAGASLFRWGGVGGIGEGRKMTDKEKIADGWVKVNENKWTKSF